MGQAWGMLPMAIEQLSKWVKGLPRLRQGYTRSGGERGQAAESGSSSHNELTPRQIDQVAIARYPPKGCIIIASDEPPRYALIRVRSLDPQEEFMITCEPL